MSELTNNITSMIASHNIQRKSELAALKKNAQALLEMAENMENGNGSADMLAMLVNAISGMAGRISAAEARIETCRQMQEMLAQ